VPVVLIASQIMMNDMGFESIQEVDFKDCSVFCDMILPPARPGRKP